MNVTLSKAEELTGEAPRKVLYCLWNDAKTRRMSCGYFHVIECESEAKAKAKVQEVYKQDRETEYNPKSLYPHLMHSYYQREGVFVPTVIVYESSNWKGHFYGYFITRWSLEKQSGLSDIRGKLNCNFYSIDELDSEEPLDMSNIISDIERIVA